MIGKKIDNIKKTLDELLSYSIDDEILLIDDLDALCYEGDENNPSELIHTEHATVTLVELLNDNMKSRKISIVATVTDKNKLNKLFLSSRGRHLINKIIKIVNPDENKRFELFKYFLNVNIEMDNEFFVEFSRLTEGFSPNDLTKFTNQLSTSNILIHSVY